MTRCSAAMRAGAAFLAAALALCLAAGASAHRANFALTSVDWNAETGGLEIIHRLHTHHALDAVRLQTGDETVSFDSIESLARLGLYVERRFDLALPSGAPIPLEFVGAEVEGDYVLVYQEASLPRAPPALRIRNDILADVLEDEINHVNVRLGDGETRTLLFTNADRAAFRTAGETAGNRAAPPPETKPAPLFVRYVGLGFEHILPKGLDHILFVLGLFLSTTRLRPLVFQVSAFTLAHSITLALAALGAVSLPASIVEPLIALSIAVIAAENILFPRAAPWRPLIVFAFGLLHGLGFAGVLAELGMPTGRMAGALAGFNIGVELGQLTVIGAAWLALRWVFAHTWYRPYVQVPGSALIGAVGLYWTVTRAFGG